MSVDLTAEQFAKDVKGLGEGMRMGDLFALAKTYDAMEPAEIRKLLTDPVDEVRLGAVSIMDFQARSRKTSPDRRLELYELYMHNHDRIDNWSLVDRAAPYVVGGYLWDRSREPLYELARSPRPMERRTAIVATYYFIRQHDLEDTFRIGAILAHDPDELVQKAVGGWVREAGKQDVERLRRFLDEFAATMPRTALRYAVEHLDPAERQHYLGMKASAAEGRQA
jgi:3-methyladenine DNA glycosylase AlkD